MKEVWKEIKRDKWWFLAETVVFLIGLMIVWGKDYKTNPEVVAPVIAITILFTTIEQIRYHRK